MYADPDTIHEELAAQPGLRLVPPVRLLRSDWIISRAAELRASTSAERRRELMLPRRQELEELEPSAFYTAEEVKNLPRGPRNAGFPMAVLAVSHSWESAGHPDPDGRTLVLLAHAITTAQTFQVGVGRTRPRQPRARRPRSVQPSRRSLRPRRNNVPRAQDMHTNHYMHRMPAPINPLFSSPCRSPRVRTLGRPSLRAWPSSSTTAPSTSRPGRRDRSR